MTKLNIHHPLLSLLRNLCEATLNLANLILINLMFSRNG